MTYLEHDKKLAIIIPVYNEGKALISNFNEMNSILTDDGVICTFLFVDDGSKDSTWSSILELSSVNSNVHGIKFARNFGKELALAAGADSIDADLYLFMDSDLQHPPRFVKTMLTLMTDSGADIIEGVKSNRGHETLKYRLLAKNFYKFLKFVTHLDLDNSSDFKLINRQVIDSIRHFGERNLFFRGVVSWVGFNVIQMPFEVDDRKNGTSQFSFPKLASLALNAIMSYTSAPLYVVLFCGFLFMIFAFILGVQTLYNYMSGNAVDGFSTVILLILTTGSLVLLSLGIIGIYVSRIYDEIKGRPRYIIERRI